VRIKSNLTSVKKKTIYLINIQS